MDYNKWEPVYREILKKMKLSRADDEISSVSLFQQTQNRELLPISELEGKIAGKKVVIVGPALSEPVKEKLKEIVDGSVVICAGSAIMALQKLKIYPDILVTDIDGEAKDVIRHSKRGGIVVLHAHGDNIESIKRIVSKLNLSDLVPTTQSTPYMQIQNFGGFTDGDRAVLLAEHFGASEINIIGFNFNKPVNASKNHGIKQKKLNWAKRIIGDFAPQAKFIE